MKVSFNDKSFMNDINNILGYVEGFLDGVNSGHSVFINELGKSVVEKLKDFIDLNARVDPQMLHHVYEWQQVGQETGRLFDISYSTNNGGLSINSTFSQSSSVALGANQPFYDKARIMENGIPVTIVPKTSSVLSFDVNGERVFTKNPVHVDRPGGAAVQGSYEKTFDSFFRDYFSQSMLSSSGLRKYIEDANMFKANFARSKKGKSFGKETGYNWIVKAGGIV